MNSEFITTSFMVGDQINTLILLIFALLICSFIGFLIHTQATLSPYFMVDGQVNTLVLLIFALLICSFIGFLILAQATLSPYIL